MTNDIQEFPDRSAHHRTSGSRADFVGSHLDSQVGADSAKIKTDDSAAVRGSSRALRRVDDLGDDDAVGMPHVAMSTATRGKSEKVKPRVKSTIKHATRGKSALPPKVEDVKASKGTWAFRLRWNSLPGRPVIYVSRVADSTYELIKKGNYEDFKQQLISSYIESAIRASNKA